MQRFWIFCDLTLRNFTPSLPIVRFFFSSLRFFPHRQRIFTRVAPGVFGKVILPIKKHFDKWHDIALRYMRNIKYHNETRSVSFWHVILCTILFENKNSSQSAHIIRYTIHNCVPRSDAISNCTSNNDCPGSTAWGLLLWTLTTSQSFFFYVQKVSCILETWYIEWWNAFQRLVFLYIRLSIFYLAICNQIAHEMK